MKQPLPHWMLDLRKALELPFSEFAQKAVATADEMNVLLERLNLKLARRELKRHFRYSRQRTTQGQNAQRRANLKRLEEK